MVKLNVCKGKKILFWYKFGFLSWACCPSQRPRVNKIMTFPGILLNYSLKLSFLWVKIQLNTRIILSVTLHSALLPPCLKVFTSWSLLLSQASCVLFHHDCRWKSGCGFMCLSSLRERCCLSSLCNPFVFCCSCLRPIMEAGRVEVAHPA